MKFNIITFGCKVNSYESEFIKEQLIKNNFIYEDDYLNSDIIIINTCSVTNNADNKSNKTIRSVKRNNPEAILVVCGCSAENHKEKLKEYNIDILIGNKDKSKIVDLINNYLENHTAYCKFYEERNNVFEPMTVSNFNTKTRAFVKIQDGCNNFCSYCIIPYIRGSIRSKDFDEAVNEITQLVAKGHQEIVFTGINTGAYGKETGKYDIVDLIREISKLDNLKRIRISSIEITEINDKFIEELKNNQKLCSHLHVSLQSGSARILKLMNRKYTKEQYLEKINKIRMVRPLINLTTDVIVGFPGESDAEFNECIEFCKKVGFSKIHVFPYSKRDGTQAATMPNQIDGATKKQRARELIKVDEDLQMNYFKKFLNQKVDVLIEEVIDDTYSIGHTENFLKVEIAEKLQVNKFYNVLIKDVYPDKVIGIRLK